MPTPTMIPVEKSTPPPADGELFDLDVRFIESGPIIPELLRSTSDNCGSTCASACTRSQSRPKPRWGPVRPPSWAPPARTEAPLVYQVLDALLLRASTQPVGLDVPPWPDLTEDPDLAREWLSAVWSREQVAYAISLASPDLARQ